MLISVKCSPAFGIRRPWNFAKRQAFVCCKYINVQEAKTLSARSFVAFFAVSSLAIFELKIVQKDIEKKAKKGLTNGALMAIISVFCLSRRYSSVGRAADL